MNKKPYIIPSKTNNKNMERYLHRKLTKVESNDNKAQTISGNEEDTTKYPSCKAVADLVGTAIGDIETILATI